MITLITPTRDRPEAYALCEKYMARQTYAGPKQWIVVDDGDTPIKPTLGQTYIRRATSPSPNTLALNLLEAVKHIDPSSETILFIEDDEWYGPAYLQKMTEYVKGYQIAGLGFHRYYNVLFRRWRVIDNMNFAALCVTAITPPLLKRLVAACEQAVAKKDSGVDMRLWCDVFWEKKNEFTQYQADRDLIKNVVVNNGLQVGIKAMPGRDGLTSGHKIDKEFLNGSDEDAELLRIWIGDEDAKTYLPYALPGLPRALRVRPKPTLTVSVVIHNQLSALRAFLLGLYKVCPLDKTEIIISDNASTDKTAAFRFDIEVPMRGMPTVRWARYEGRIEDAKAHENAREMARGDRFVVVGEDFRVPTL